MNFEIESNLRRHLDPTETLLWADKPKPGLMLRLVDMLIIPFSLMWGSFAIFWEASVITDDAPLAMKLFGIPFVLLGLYFIIGRFFFDAFRRKRLTYGLTAKRIIIQSNIFKETVKSINLKTLSDISLTENADGTGTIVLGTENSFSGLFRGSGLWLSHGQIAPALENIENARVVYKKITDLQLKT